MTADSLYDVGARRMVVKIFRDKAWATLRHGLAALQEEAGVSMPMTGSTKAAADGSNFGKDDSDSRRSKEASGTSEPRSSKNAGGLVIASANSIKRTVRKRKRMGGGDNIARLCVYV